MRARKLGLFLTSVAIIGLIIFSSFLTSKVFGATRATLPNLNKSGSANIPKGANFDEAVVLGHQVTSSEIQTIRNKVGVSVEGRDYNQIVDGHGTGLRAPTASEWQEISQTAQTVESVAYLNSPSSVDNSLLSCFPPIGNQGGEGSCVAWAVGYYVKTFQEAQEHGWDLSGATWVGGYSGYPTSSYQDEVMSPDFIYHLINGGVDSGATFEDAINLMCSVGVSSWETMPYSWTDHASWPSEQAWTEASYYRSESSGIHYLGISTDQGLNSLKNWIAADNLAIIGVDAHKIVNQATHVSLLTSDDMLTLDNYVNPDINHANTIVGFDDSLTYTEGGQQAQGAFKIANSWGIGGWENIDDGFYWISYEAMKQQVGFCMFFDDIIGYQPELTATFRIDHAARGECQIIVGAGSPSSPIATKSFTQHINGGSFPFPSNNIVFDITELGNQLPRLFNESYYLKVRDLGTPMTGTVTGFSVGDTSSSDAPQSTVNNNDVYLTLCNLVITSELWVSPTSGPAGTAITLVGVGFTPDSSVNLSYLNPATSSWVSVVNDTATNSEGQFSYDLNAPDLLQSGLAGDHPAAFDTILLRAMDNDNGLFCDTSTPYSEWRRGLTRVGNAEASWLYGDNTDLTSAVAVVSGQTLLVEGQWFSPDDVTVFWDGTTTMGTAQTNEIGYFNASFTVPTTIAGRHEIVLVNGNVDFHVSVARLPTTADDYDGSWHNSEFTINLTPDAGGCETYYKINEGTICRVSVDGQPLIVTEGGNNTLDYWSVDEFGNEELPHKTLADVKLDKVAPFGSIQIGSGAEYASSVYVTLILTAGDSLSGVNQVRFSNDGIWDTEAWEAPSATKNWTLTLGDGAKTVHYQIVDNAGLNSSYSVLIILDTTRPSVNAGQNQVVAMGSPVTFVASECEDNVGISSYVWNFGDGATVEGLSATHTYSSSGTYTATLTVQDLAGNTASSSVTITVQNNMGSNVPEFSSIFMLPLLVAVTFLSLIVKRKSSAKTRTKASR
jgi:hypothetical protein